MNIRRRERREMARSAKTEGALEVTELMAGEVTVNVLGASPMIINRMAAKARQELLYPRGRLSSAQKASNVKHDPLAEFRDSVHCRPGGENGPTRLLFPAPAFKAAMATAALDIPSKGVTKSKINRLTWVKGQMVDIYGVPQMMMSVVRSADMAHTPDIRTRAILPEWAARVTIRYVMPVVRETMIAVLLGASGLIVGIGDFRQEKGKGSYGQFEIVEERDPRLLRIIETGGMAAQDAALADPDFYDADTEDLFRWFVGERDRRSGEPPRNRRIKEASEIAA